MALKELSKRLDIKSIERESDGAGGFIEQPVTIVTVWGDIKGLSGKEQWQAYQKESEVTIKIRIRYRKDIDRTNIVEYKGRIFEIQYIINENEENKFLDLFCIEKV